VADTNGNAAPSALLGTLRVRIPTLPAPPNLTHTAGSIGYVDLLAATPGEDINWLEDIHLLREEGVPAVFDRYSNSFLKIYFPIPEGREDEIARKVLIKHLQTGNSYGIQLKEKHTKFAQPELGSWVPGSKTVGTDWKPPVLEGWEPPLH